MASASRPEATPVGGPTLPDEESPEVLRGYYRQMVLIRAFELRAAEMYQRGRIGGYCHLNLGEEATVVGLMAALAPHDYLFATYREHGYALARGIDPGQSRHRRHPHRRPGRRPARPRYRMNACRSLRWRAGSPASGAWT